MALHHSMMELIGNTPMVALHQLQAALALPMPLFAKLEMVNPTGSVKDRAALAMLDDALARGLLVPGGVIIEPTSGNTGIGLAAIAAVRGYRVILTMPETMSLERRRLLSAYGAEIVLTEGARGMAGAIAKAEELQREIPGAFIPGQFQNPANPQAHRRTTGPEIWRDMAEQVDVFVAGVGTGGTLSGVGGYLKEVSPGMRVVAVEPKASQVLGGGKAGPHGLQGIGAGFVPEALDTAVIDEVVPVTEADAYNMGRLLAKREGILAGISSGAALWAAAEIAQRPGMAGKRIVVLLPDHGDRYLSTPLFQEGE